MATSERNNNYTIVSCMDKIIYTIVSHMDKILYTVVSYMDKILYTIVSYMDTIILYNCFIFGYNNFIQLFHM